MSELKSFLLEMALAASPKRFFPFPKYFRKRPAESDDPFAPYSNGEYTRMLSVLQTLEHTNVSDMCETQQELLNYIMTERVGIAFHGYLLDGWITEYEFRYSAQEERIIRVAHPERWYVYHGSNLGNWHSIIRNGIRSMSGTALQSNGQAYGQGVYTSKSIAIGQSYGASRNNCSYVAVIELYEDPERYRCSNREFILLPPNLKITPRYLLKINNGKRKKTATQQDSEALLDYYRAARKASDDSSRCERRVHAEIKSIAGYIKNCSEDGKKITIEIERFALTLYIDGFPFAPPLICLTNQPDRHIETFDDQGIYQPVLTEDWSPIRRLSDILAEVHVALLDANPTDIGYQPLA